MLRRSFACFLFGLIVSQTGTAQHCFRVFGEESAAVVGTQPPQGTTGSKGLIIVVFGGSTTAPRGSLRIFAKVLEEQLAPVTVINAGVPGNTTRLARERFERDVLSHRPDFFTIYFGTNDSAVDVFKGATEPRVSINEYEQNLTWMIKQLLTRRIQPILITPNPIAWTDELKALYGNPPYRPDDPDGWNVILKDYVAVVRRVARTLNVPLVDTYQLFKSYAAAGGHDLHDLLLDGMHPNDLGHKIIADRLIDIIRTSNVAGGAARHHRT